MQKLIASYDLDYRAEDLADKLNTEPSVPIKLSNTSFDSVLFVKIAQKTNKTSVIVCANHESANELFYDIKVINQQIPTILFESSIYIKNKISLKSAKKTNNQLLAIEALETEEKKIIITYPEAVIEKFLVPKELGHILKLKIGDKISLISIVEYLENNGYERTSFVYEFGQYAIRGNIFDIYSYSYKEPVRIELFDVVIEGMRFFHIETQLSIEEISEIKVTINPKLRSGNTYQVKSILNYAKDNILWSIEERNLRKILSKEIELLMETPSEIEEGIENCILKESVLSQLFKQKNHIVFSEMGKILNIDSHPLIHKNFNKLYLTIETYLNSGYHVYIMSDEEIQKERYEQIFSDLGGKINFTHVLKEFSRGFIDEKSKKLVLTTHEIFSKRLYFIESKDVNSSAQAQLLKSMRELVPGDYVTHLDHGVGKFSGLEKIESNGHFQEAVRLIYANNDILYVHINSLHKISKYVGKDNLEPRMHRLGSDTWENVKRKTKKKIKDIAEDLIKLYAKRKATKGFAYSPDTYLQYELETSFEYEDTPDQAKASLDVKMDMEKEIPMDRLICGDVGFGKTEVAIRAAFKAVADSKQVAVLVPTTLLAFQHYYTFKKRLEGLPCNIEFINRFKTAKQKSEILKKLEAGGVDILIGTHALVGKNVKFKDLGLLIVDEEQKFGVQVKDKLKEIKLNVDTLTLTATPIPRTLQFSLLGARDYSLIQTPPPSRQSIYTEVTSFDPEYIKEIIQNEIKRGGQVFFVHNRVKDLSQIKEILEKVLPDIDLAIAHGQLEGSAIEQILIDFMDKKYDVLLSTNILESGIDIPNANTILINNAHQFGLSDLHQLRGRVGRSNKKAFCYLISPPYSTLTSDAKQRLNALEHNAELGSGFQIAMRDLDLRGAGNMLGGEQSGFLSDIGYDTFMKILDEAILELKEGDYKELYENANATKNQEIEYSKECQIETESDMFIPDNFISSSQDRMKVYTELNQIKNETELKIYLSKIKDVYGTLPIQINEISSALKLKWKATKLGIERIHLKSGKMKCYLIQNQDAAFYQSETFGIVLNYLVSFPEGIVMKQTSQNVIIEFSHIKTNLEANERLASVLEFVHSNIKR